MPLNEHKIISIILGQCDKVPQRCPGYRKELISTLTDIIQLERQHRVQGTNIQVKINDKCNAAGVFLDANSTKQNEEA